MAKAIRIAPEGTVNWSTLTGNTGGFKADANILNDTIFGQQHQSGQPDIIGWTIDANALIKGTSGYSVLLEKSGTPTIFTDAACSLIAGTTKEYLIDDITKDLWSPETKVTVKDNGTVVTEVELEYIDYLTGTIKFKTGYSVTGPVTVSGKSLVTSQICAMNKYTLNMTATANDSTDLCAARTNGGFKQFVMGLNTTTLEMSGFHVASDVPSYLTILKNRDVVVITVNPDGEEKSIARGFFKPSNIGQSGGVGAIEEANVSWVLYVPDVDDLLKSPFSWTHKSDTLLNQSIITLLSAMAKNKSVEVRYLEDGIVGRQGNAIPTSLSLSGGIDTLNEFSVTLQGSGGITEV